MIPSSPIRLITTAGALLDGGRPVAGTLNLAAQFLAEVRASGMQPWDAAFVHHAGRWSHFDHRLGESSWPLPPTPDCDELADAAQVSNVLSDEAPEPGDVFLLWSPAKQRFVHTGIILQAERDAVRAGRRIPYECLTIEGNVTSTGSLGGNRLARVRRMLTPERGDRIIKWVEIVREPGSRVRVA